MLPNTITYLQKLYPVVIDLRKSLNSDVSVKGKAEVSYIAKTLVDPEELLNHVEKVSDTIDALSVLLAPAVSSDSHRSDTEDLQNFELKLTYLYKIPYVLGSDNELNYSLALDGEPTWSKTNAAGIFCNDVFAEAYCKLIATALRYHTIPESLRNNEFEIIGRSLNSLIMIFFSIIVRAERAFIGAEIFDKSVLSSVYRDKLNFVSFEKLPTKTYFTEEEEAEMERERERQRQIKREEEEAEELMLEIAKAKNAYDSVFVGTTEWVNYDNHILSMATPVAVKRLKACIDAVEVAFNLDDSDPKNIVWLAKNILTFPKDSTTHDIFLNPGYQSENNEEPTYADIKTAFTFLTNLGLFYGQVWDSDNGQLIFESHSVEPDESVLRDMTDPDSTTIPTNQLFTLKKPE